MSDATDTFNELASTIADVADATYAERKEHERIDDLRRRHAVYAKRVADQGVSLQGRYDASKEVVSLLYSLDAYSALGDLSIDEGIVVCKELHQQLQLKKEYDSMDQKVK
jgi:hypothetical protein